MEDSLLNVSMSGYDGDKEDEDESFLEGKEYNFKSLHVKFSGKSLNLFQDYINTVPHGIRLQV